VSFINHNHNWTRQLTT